MTVSESNIKMTEMDKKTYDSTAQLIKAAMPYTNAATARLLAVAAKILELKKALECMQHPEPELNICALPGQKPSPEEMLSDLRKYCDPSQAEMIDRMLGILNMGKFYEKYKELESSPEFQKMMHMMKSMQNTNPAGSPGAGHSANGGQTVSNAGHTMEDVLQAAADAMPSSMDQFNNPAMINNLKNMLSPEQRQMFETLMSMNKE